MRAPARGIVDGKLLPMCEVKPHGKVYRQMDDELLSAFEADCATGVPALATMMGMMMARIREAEKDRDHLLAALVLLLPMARSWADGGHSGDADDKVVSAAQALVDELAPESIDPPHGQQHHAVPSRAALPRAGGRRMSGIVWGFTGTQLGMTPAQYATVRRLLAHPGTPAAEAHHGDCIGADDQFDELCEELRIHTVVHPPSDPKKRAWCLRRWAASGSRRRSVVEVAPKPYLDRNHDIVDAVVAEGALIGTPHEPEMQVRSGTWATLRYADNLRATMRIVQPDGAVRRFL